MKCDRVRDLLSLHVGGELEQTLEMPVRDHLRGCPACRRELERIGRARKTAVAALRSLKAPQPGEKFWAEIERRLEDEALYGAGKLQTVAAGNSEAEVAEILSAGAFRSPRGHGFWRILLTAAAAAVLIALIGVGIERNGIDTQPEYTVRGAEALGRLPIVESVNDPNVTVMTFQTDDPHVTIAWFFEEDTEVERR